ncbi:MULTISPECIES: Lrp/AsnC family transcriptional regulator [Streptacidiphilus]|uniref:Lrp/AsnC family transcriptional regulator n=2 Tax=Streptacidiphilus TaxID=228398 RepID=A0ABV6UXW6_9ACTN|nr:AsnC family transcriptional regulator [Streptacidiphilus jeojiense]
MIHPALDPLDLRVIAALQINGRASWRAVAQALGQSERTVARRGTRLLETGVVRVVGLENFAETAVVRLRCAPGAARRAAAALAGREDVVFACTVAGVADCVAELQCPAERLEALALDELPQLPGALGHELVPVLRYYRTAREWRPFPLADEQAALLDTEPAPVQGPTPPEGEQSADELAILRALARDGRLTHEELAAIAGVSKATARRRVEQLIASARVAIRAVVAPGPLGLPVESLLWVRTRPGAQERTARRLLGEPMVRYAAALMGEFDLLVNTTHRSRRELHAFLTESAWLQEVDRVSPSLVLGSLKRGGLSR